MRQDDFYLDDRPSKFKYILLITVTVLLLITIFAGAYFLVFGGNEKDAYESISASSDVLTETMPAEDEDIQSSEDISEITYQETSEPSEVQTPQEEPHILIAEGSAETAEITSGIDVSRYQGNIDWSKVAADGIDFAMIRVGYRTLESGEIVEDSSAKYNMQEAAAHGIKLGVYFFSTAITEEEAIEEAKWVADFVAQYPITYPVVYDCENYENPKSRQLHLTKEERTGLAKVFLNKIFELGYTPMFYASRNELLGDNKWITSELEKTYKIWLSWYPGLPYPQIEKADYMGAHSMWQYTNNGTISGVNAPVDINVAYFGYETAATPKDTTPPERVEADVEAGHTFTEVDETVTAKEATNLRNIPSQGSDSQVMHTLQNGQTAIRTGISSSGWSRLVYNGETYYAVSSLLTTDLTVKVPEPVPPTEESTQKPDEGIQTTFISCDERVSPKIEVNLRNIPSVTSGESMVVATVKYGEIFRRTGINEDHGWSRVEYNGQTLYCVSSYIYVYEEPAEE